MEGPMQGTLLFLARNRSGLHSVVWVLEKDKFVSPMLPVSEESFDGLLRAKNAEMLLDSIRGLGALTTEETVFKKEGKRLYSISDFKRRLPKMKSSDAAMLYKETFLYPFCQEGEPGDPESERRSLGLFEELGADVSLGNMQAAIRAAARYDAFSNGIHDVLDKCDDSSHVVYCEPLQDWMLVRNLLSLAAQLYYWANTPEAKDSPLSALSHVRRYETVKYLKRPAFALPISFNTAGRLRSHANLARMWDAVLENYAKANPLFCSGIETPRDQKYLNALKHLHFWSQISKDENVLFLSAYQVEGTYIGKEASREAKWQAMYMVIVPRMRDGIVMESERDMADRLFYDIERAFFTGPNGVRAHRLCGWGRGDVNESDGDSLMGYKSLMGALWHRIFHHRAVGFVTCRNCGNTVLRTTKGKRSLYCSDSCRSAAAHAQMKLRQRES